MRPSKAGPVSKLRILVDADACPVKEEIYRVAERHKVPVSVVSNSPFRVPVSPLVERVVVSDSFDAGTWSDHGLPLEERARKHAAYESWVVDAVVPHIRADSG